MIAKRLRMVLDFEVTVEELTEESLREYYRRFTGGEEGSANAEDWASRSRQIRLQRALLEDGAALRRFLTYVVTNEVDPSLDSRLREEFGVGGERADEEILESVFSRLDAEDARYFREASESESLFITLRGCRSPEPECEGQAGQGGYKRDSSGGGNYTRRHGVSLE